MMVGSEELVDYQKFWDELPDFIKYNPGAKHRRRIIINMLKQVPFTSVLDVGCGSGDLLSFLSRDFADRRLELVGCDLSEPQLKINQEKFPSMKFIPLDLQKAHLDKRFDMVICSEVIEHLADQKASLINLTAMVKPGGHLFITCPSGKIHATEVHFGHLKHLSPQDLSEMVRPLGFEPVETLNWGWPFYKVLKFATNTNPEWALRNFTGNYGFFQKVTSNLLYVANFLNSNNHSQGVQIFALYRKRNSDA